MNMKKKTLASLYYAVPFVWIIGKHISKYKCLFFSYIWDLRVIQRRYNIKTVYNSKMVEGPQGHMCCVRCTLCQHKRLIYRCNTSRKSIT